MTRLVLCRHTREGDAEEAAVLAAALADTELTAIYTSPHARARDTAVAVAAGHGLDPVVVDDLREIDRGDVEGAAFDDYPEELQRALLVAPLRTRFPAGETYDELRTRVVAALDGIVASHDDGTIAVVSHAGPIRAAFAAWLHIEGTAFFRIDQRLGAMNVVDWVDGVPLVRLVNG